MEYISLFLSILGSVLGVISIYYSRFKIGKLKVLPIRIYRITPFSTADGSIFRITLPLTFFNTGAVLRAINDLRIRLVLDTQDTLILKWLEEHNEINLFDESKEKRWTPIQPTLKPYESINRIYSFQNDLKDSEKVKKMNQQKEEKKYPAYIEYRDEKNRWKILNKFNIYYNGKMTKEMDYERINN